MALIIHTYLLCDKCGNEFGEETKRNNAKGQRTVAKQKGWRCSGGKDICPACRQRRKKRLGKRMYQNKQK